MNRIKHKKKKRMESIEMSISAMWDRVKRSNI